MNTPYLSFNGGELTPLLRHRTDFAKHPSGAARMENFLPLPHGGITRRPGTRYRATLPNIPASSVAFPFTTTDGTRYIVIATPGNLYVIGLNDGLTKATIPYLTPNDDAALTQYAQINDVAYLTHPLTHPLRLASIADNDWQLAPIPFTAPPVLDPNLDDNRFISILSNPVAAPWANATAYTAANVVLAEGSEWQAIQAHTSTPATRPGTGSNFAAFWTRKIFDPGDPVSIISYGVDAPDWRNEPPFYIQNTIITKTEKHHPDLNPFGSSTPVHIGPIRAKATHSALAISTDGKTINSTEFGNNWQTIHDTYIWQIDGPAITIGQLYLDTATNKLYQAIANKSSADVDPAADQPETGTFWETTWENITAASDLSTINTLHTYPFYTTGQRVNVSGVVYQAKTTHYTSNASRPGTGADWQTFWETIPDPASIFDPLHAAALPASPGSYWEISPSREDKDFQVQLFATTANNGRTSTPIAVQGTWSFNTFGTWNGTYQIQRSANNGQSWETIRNYESSGDRNVAVAGTEDTAVLLRLRFTATSATSGSTTARGVLTPEQSFIRGHALATTYISTNQLTGTAIAPLLSGRTTRWAEGAFSRLRGHPQAITFHDARLVLAGTTARPTTLYFSAVDNFRSFLQGTDPADALAITLATSQTNRVRWLASQRRLFVGTAAEEWIIGTIDAEAAITPADVFARRHTSFGSAHRQPAPLADSFVFLSRASIRLREIAYVDERQAYSAPELTRIADHLTAAGITSLAWQQSREPSLWATTADGLLLHFAFNREDQITAWSRHTTTHGTPIAVVTFPGTTGAEDTLAIILQRTIGSTTIHTLELITDPYSTPTGSTSANPFDLAIYHTGDTPITTPAILDGIELAAIIDGQPATVTPTAGQVTLPEGTATAVIGLPITATLATLPLDIGTGQPDATHARRKRLHALNLNLIASQQATITYAGNTPEPIRLPSTPYTGWHEVALPPAHTDDAEFTITTQHPFTLLAAALRWNQTERKA